MLWQIKKAIILAAGRGKRLRPLTDHTPKPLLPVWGKPLLDHTLQAVAEVGVEEVCLVTHYLGEQIKAFVQDGNRWGLRVTYRYQPQINGTGQAVLVASDFLTEPCWLIAGDYALLSSDLHPLLETYHQTRAEMVVGLKQLPASELSKRSSVRLNEQNEVLEIVEKPNAGTAPSSFAASFLYIVPPALRHHLQRLTLSPRGEYELPQAINQLIQAGYKLIGVLQPSPKEYES